MTTYSGTEFNDLAKLLFKCLTTLTPNFNPSKYLDEFSSKKTNLDKVNFVYQDIKKYPKVFAKFCKDDKDDERAMEHIDSGKIKCNSGSYWGALEDFSRAVATAENDKVLALAYGYRSECFLKLKMPDKCLKEIERALVHYPKDLIESLQERKKEAEKINGSPIRYYESVVCDLYPFEANPAIQCANNCVKIGHDDSGSFVVATRDIEVGEILSIEQPFATVLTSSRVTHCHHCLGLSYNPIPCNNCTVALFCSEECKYNASTYHKYECPILLTLCYRVLCEFAIDETILLALKVALLAKDDYSQLEILSFKDKNFYRSDRFKEIYLLESLSQPSPITLFHHAILTAQVFELLWNYTSFFSSIFSNSDTNDRFKEIMLKQLQISFIDSAKIYEYVYKKFEFNGTENFGYGAYSFFPLFAHSCCANVMKTYHGTTMVLRALNTIKKGEQCFVNRYGLRYDSCPKSARSQFIATHRLPDCRCRACAEDWVGSSGDLQQICAGLGIEVMELGEIIRDVIGTDVGKAEKILPDLIAQLKECESSEPDGNSLALKSLIVHCFVICGNKRVEETQRDIVLAP